MKFDISSMHTIFEEADSSKPTTSPLVKSLQIPVVQDEENDRTGANLDSSLAHADLNKLFDDICPITGNVFAAMKNAAADPHNLKISAVKSGDGDKADLFIEAVEFATFCEASGLTIGEAVDKIIEAYEGQEDIPELDNADFHVVFPSDSLNKNILGGENLGRDVKNDWAMQLMRGCRRYGLKVNAGVEVEPTNESVTIIKDMGMQGRYSNKALNGVKIELYLKNIDSKEDYDKASKKLNENYSKIKDSYKGAIDYLINWYNKTGDDKIYKSDLDKPYCIVYFAHDNSYEVDFEINDTPYAVAIENLNNPKYSCFAI